MKNNKALNMKLPGKLYARIEQKAEENSVSVAAYIRMTMTKACR